MCEGIEKTAEPVKHLFPEDKTLELLELMDGDRTHVGKYKTWKFIEKYVPEIAEDPGVEWIIQIAGSRVFIFKR